MPHKNREKALACMRRYIQRGAGKFDPPPPEAASVDR